MVRRRRFLVEALEPRLVLSTLGLQGPDRPGGPPERFIVTLDPAVSDVAQAAQAMIGPWGGRVGHVYEDALKGFSVELPPAAAEHLLNNPHVETIEPDVLVHALGDTVPEGVRRIGRPAEMTYPRETAWNETITDDARVDVDIAIIDTGIKDHFDLNIAGGRRFYTVDIGPPRSRGSFEDGNFTDDHGHGTHVAGTAAARDQGWGYIGVAPGARLWGVKVLNSSGSGYVSDIIAGVNWVVALKDADGITPTIEVVNMSLGWPGGSAEENSAMRTAIATGVAEGIVFVVAAGNDIQDVYGRDGVFGTSDDFIPAAFPEVATISAFVDTDGKPGGLGPSTEYGPDDSFASFSNYSRSVVGDNPVTSPGAAIDLMMPGVNVWSTHLNNDFVQYSGTSMASPHAAGLAALYIADNGRATDAAGVYAIRQALIDGGKAWNDPVYGLTHAASPDVYLEKIGWAGDLLVDLAPTVEITNPTDGEVLRDVALVEVTASVTEAEGRTIEQVEFFVGETSIGDGEYGDDGWSVTWDTSAYLDDTYLIRAEATDSQGDIGSHSITVYLDNVDDAPTVAITSPEPGATVSGTVVITAEASDDRGVAQVEFFVGETSIGVGDNVDDTWSITWETSLYNDGDYTIRAEATDTGTPSQSASASIPVTVDNSVPTLTVELDGWAQSINKNFWKALVSVTIADGSGSVTGANVVGTFTWNGSSLTRSGTTNAAGQVEFSTDNLSTRSVTSVDFFVVSIDGVAYDGEGVRISQSGQTTPLTADLYAQLALWQAVEEAESARPKQRERAVEAIDYLMAYQE